jgi:hypothetical protein
MLNFALISNIEQHREHLVSQILPGEILRLVLDHAYEEKYCKDAFHVYQGDWDKVDDYARTGAYIGSIALMKCQKENLLKSAFEEPCGLGGGGYAPVLQDASDINPNHPDFNFLLNIQRVGILSCMLSNPT